MFGFRNKEKNCSDEPTELEQLEQDRNNLKREIKDLKADKRELKEKVADLELKKKMEDEDIKHMVKIQTEQNEIELQKKCMENDKKAQEAIAKVKDEYRDKMEKQLTKETENIKTMYGQILERLPNVNMKISQKDG